MICWKRCVWSVCENSCTSYLLTISYSYLNELCFHLYTARSFKWYELSMFLLYSSNLHGPLSDWIWQWYWQISFLSLMTDIYIYIYIWYIYTYAGSTFLYQFCFLWFTNCVLLSDDNSLMPGCSWLLAFVLNSTLILGIWCSTIPHLPGCFCPWTFFQNIGFNMVPSDPFVSHLATQPGYSAGEFQALQLIVLATLVGHMAITSRTGTVRGRMKIIVCAFGVMD